VGLSWSRSSAHWGSGPKSTSRRLPRTRMGSVGLRGHD